MSVHRVLNVSQLIAMRPLGWQFVVRSGRALEAGNFFVHLFREGEGEVAAQSFKVWADTPEKAFYEALSQVFKNCGDAAWRAEQGTELNV